MRKKKSSKLKSTSGPSLELQKAITAFPKEVKLKEKAAREKKEL